MRAADNCCESAARCRDGRILVRVSGPAGGGGWNPTSSPALEIGSCASQDPRDFDTGSA